MRSKLLIFCTVLTIGLLCATGCGRDGNNNDTQAPYEDEANQGVNEGRNAGNDLRDAGENLMDSIQDAGNALKDGVDDMGNGANTTNDAGSTINMNDAGTTNNGNTTNRNGQ